MEKQIDVVTIDNREYNKQRKQERIKNLQIRKRKMRCVLVAMGFIGVIFGAKWASHEHAVGKASGEVLSDAGLNILDDGSLADSHMTEEELAQYVNEHNITLEELSNAVGSRLKWDALYSEDNMEKIENLNSEAFEEATKNSKGM